MARYGFCYSIVQIDDVEIGVNGLQYTVAGAVPFVKVPGLGFPNELAPLVVD